MDNRKKTSSESKPLSSEPYIVPPPSFREIYKSSGGELPSRIAPVGKILGQGPYSSVYQGTLTGSGQSVVIKADQRPIMSTHKSKSEFEAVQREVETLKCLDHPSIARLIDWIPDWEDNRSYIIMQYIEGRGLNLELADKGPFPQARVLDWTFQLLDAMEYLHCMRYIIGDFDPSSIVLTPDNRVCLVSFQYQADITAKVKPHSAKIFLRYNKGDEALQAGIREDIRRLGATMFELLTGKKPEGLTPEERKRALSEKGVSAPVADVILRVMSPKPETHYSSVKEMRRALWDLPLQSGHTNSQILSLTLAAVFIMALFLIGCDFYAKGQYQIVRDMRMRADTETAVAALQNSDYSHALSAALEATRQEGNDPPCPPETQAALADTVSAYDYVAGYKPYRSDYKLRGRPLNARFSPDGDRIAVLVENTNSIPAAKRIQVFDAESADEIAVLTPSYSANSNFVFLDNDSLLYTGENAVKCYSFSEQTELWSGPAGSADEKSPVSVAVSADGKTVASVRWGSPYAFLYDTRDGEVINFPLNRPKGNAETNFFDETSMSARDNLFVLSYDGRYLAVSFPDGGAGIYDLSAPTPEEGYHELIDNSSYLHLEGGFYRQVYGSGFYEDWFFYAASTASQSSNQIPVNSEGCLIRLSNMEQTLRLARYGPIHMQADQNGIYVAVGDWLYHANTDEPDIVFWDYLAQAEGTIRLLRHAAGRVLAVTENESVLTYRDDGAWGARIANGAFNIADLAGEYALLASRNKTVLSVLRWRKQGETLLYYNANDGTDEMTYYAHLGAHIRADGETVMLYRSTGFRVYDLVTGTRVDKARDEDETSFERVAERLIYQRGQVLNGDPSQECLKVIYENDVEFYSVNGEKLSIFSRERRDEDDSVVFLTDSYHVKQDGGSGSVEIYSAMRPNRLLKQWQEDNLTYASQQGAYLILSLMTDWQEMYSLLLDENLDVVAKIPQPCEAFPYGNSLIFDDMQGRLLQGPLYTLEDLRSLANYWGMEAG